MELAVFVSIADSFGLPCAGAPCALTQFWEDTESQMDEATLAAVSEKLDDFLVEFDECFVSDPSREHMARYVRGQLGQLQRKSMEPMAIREGILPRTLQQFLSTYNWDEEAMRRKVRSIVSRAYSDPQAVAVIDETSFNKQGRKTVGVKRQWCGHTGKIDNCVQTVHMTYVAREFATIIDSDLYLPEEDWCNDNARRAEAKVPDEVAFRTKWEIALEMLQRSKSEGISIRWVTADELYGRATEFLAGVEALEKLYVCEVPRNTYGWTDRGFARGREHRRVDELFKRGGPSWQDYYVKDTTKGPVVWKVRATRFISHAGSDREEKWLLIAVNPFDGETKYFLSNAPADTTIDVLLTVAFSRWRVERNFEDSKQEIGFDHFEVRNYISLQRHIAISMVSMLFLVTMSLQLRAQTQNHWTVPQARLLVDTLVDQELIPEQRERQLKRNLFAIEYWQKRAKSAAVSHHKRRLRDLQKAGIDLAQAIKCPPWTGDT